MDLAQPKVMVLRNETGIHLRATLSKQHGRQITPNSHPTIRLECVHADGDNDGEKWPYEPMNPMITRRNAPMKKKNDPGFGTYFLLGAVNFEMKTFNKRQFAVY